MNDNLTYNQDDEIRGIEINETLDGRKIEGTYPGPEDDTPDPEENKKPRRGKKSEKEEAPAKPKRKGDRWLWGIYIILVIVSIIEPYSASSQDVHTGNIYGPLLGQLKFLFAGFILLFLIQKVHYKYFRKLAWFFALISLVLLVLSLFIGQNYNDASRAIALGGGLSLQPAEMVKLTVVLLLSTVLAKHQIRHGVSTWGCVLSAGIVMLFGALLLPNGFTNMALLMMVSLIMFLIGGIEMRKLGVIVLVYAVLGGCAGLYKMNRDKDKEKERKELVAQQQEVKEQSTGRSATWKARLKRHFAGVSPNDTIHDKNRQVMFANFAMARGGVVGAGVGTSRESSRVPLAFSDYIYSIIVEDAGLVGGLLLMLVYITLVFRAGVVAYNCNRAFPALLIMGCAVMIVLQALVHMAIVTGVFPVSGQPLPLISRGGTSIVIMSIAFGMMLSVSKFAVQKGSNREVKAEQAELPESMHSLNPSQGQ